MGVCSRVRDSAAPCIIYCALPAYFIGARCVVTQNTPYSKRNSNRGAGGGAV